MIYGLSVGFSDIYNRVISSRQLLLINDLWKSLFFSLRARNDVCERCMCFSFFHWANSIAAIPPFGASSEWLRFFSRPILFNMSIASSGAFDLFRKEKEKCLYVRDQQQAASTADYVCIFSRKTLRAVCVRKTMYEGENEKDTNRSRTEEKEGSCLLRNSRTALILYSVRITERLKWHLEGCQISRMVPFFIRKLLIGGIWILYLLFHLYVDWKTYWERGETSFGILEYEIGKNKRRTHWQPDCWIQRRGRLFSSVMNLHQRILIINIE